MNKLKLFLTALALTTLLPYSVYAHGEQHAVAIESGGAECAPTGELNPQNLTIAPGTEVELKFNMSSNDNTQSGLEIRGFPSGDFIIKPGESTTVHYTVENDLTYEAYLADENCLKATGNIFIAESNTTTNNSGNLATDSASLESSSSSNDLLKIIVLSVGGLAALSLLGSLYYILRTRS